MLERETELIKEIILASTINGRDAVKLNEVIAASLPRGIKTFMTARVAGMLEEDLRNSRRLKQITQSISSTVTAERALLHSLALEFTLNREEFLRLTDDAIHFLENYLCRPQWTLNQLMFEKDRTISFNELIRKFEIVSEYSYYAILVERHARRKKMAELEAEYFKQLLTRIDNEIVKNHTPRELALLAKPIFDFLLLGDQSMTRPIPLGTILLFYEDKNLMNVKTYIERICQVRNRTQLSLAELIEIIEDLYTVETTVQKDVEESEQEILSPLSVVQSAATETHTEENVAEALSVLNEETGDQPHQGEETSMAAEESSVDAGAVQEPTLVTQMNPVFPIDTEVLERDIPEPPVEITHAVGANVLVEYARERQSALRAKQRPEVSDELVSAPQSDLPDIHDLLSPAQRTKFLHTVFQDDEAYYGIFLAAINRTANWREAQQHLRELFELKKLDILAPDVIEFTDAMHSRFDPSLRHSS